MSFLEDYGAAEARRERKIRRVRRALLALLAIALVGVPLYLWFKNYRQEKLVERFLNMLAQGDYASGYAMWGCKVEAPCPSYDYKTFLEDWGPSSEFGKVQSFRLGRSREVGSGVIVSVTINGKQPPLRLWVEKSTGVLGFAPSLL